MIYLVLYDNRGQCQRVARASSQEQASVFLRAGFTTVAQPEYERCALLVPETTIADLPDLQTATALLNRINQQTRRPVQRATNTRALERLTARQREKLRAITEAYLNSERTLEQWYRAVVNAINAGHVAAGALGVGGIDNLTQEDREAIERANATQLGYLNRFRRDIDTLSPAAIRNRVALYAGAIGVLYWLIHTRAQGLTLPAMPGVRTSCMNNCKCTWDIRRLDGNGNWDCYWVVSAVEHCPECERRQAVFNPLQVRNYIVQPFNPSGIYT